jgi:peptide/nickel transport system substrate-binding protein
MREALHVKLSKRSGALIATGVAGAMLLTACGGGSDNGGGSGQGGRVVYGETTTWPENLFPLISAGNVTSNANIEAQVLPQAYLVQPDFTLKYNNELLTDEPVSQTSGNSQTVTYHINPDAVWSDGTPINADDFDFSWRMQRSSDPAKGGCPDLLQTTGYEQIKSVQGADNGKTVTVTYSPPFADWRGSFSTASTPLFPAHLMDKPTQQEICAEVHTGWPLAEGLPGDISGGPWQIKKESINTAQQIVVLTPNEKYWGAKPKLAQLVIQGVSNDPNTFVPGLSGGELNAVYPQPQLDMVAQIDKLKPNVTSELNFGLNFEHLDFNATDPQLADIKVRQAFALALDRQQIVDQTVGQFSSDAQVLDNHIWMNNQPQYQDNAPDQYKARDVAAAKTLLESDGYTLGPDGIYQKNGKRLSFKIDTTPGNPLRQTTIEVMIPQLKEAGIEASFNANPDIFTSTKPASLNQGGFQIALFAWVGSPFINTLVGPYISPKGPDAVGQNYSRVGSPQIDALIQQALQEPDTDKQADLGNQIDALLWDQMATIPLYQKPTYFAYGSTIQGPKDNPTQAGPLWNASTWALAQ